MEHARQRIGRSTGGLGGSPGAITHDNGNLIKAAATSPDRVRKTRKVGIISGLLLLLLLGSTHLFFRGDSTTRNTPRLSTRKAISSTNTRCASVITQKEEKGTIVSADKNVASTTIEGSGITACLKDGEQVPLPVILMTHGRSGSGSICGVLQTLTGGDEECDEYPGETLEQQLQFFRELPFNKRDGSWIIDKLCEKQRENPHAGIAMIKWKPHTNFTEPAISAGLRLIANNSDRIYLIRSRRNPLDVTISRTKHEVHKHVPSHCKTPKCVKRHFKVGRGLILNTNTLLQTLHNINNQEEEVDCFLSEMGIKHIQVSYESLFHNPENPTEEWLRIFRFLGRGPRNQLTREELDKATPFEPTSVPWHNVSLGNYFEVKDLLMGTEFEPLLH